jgi:hypothetical protein
LLNIFELDLYSVALFSDPLEGMLSILDFLLVGLELVLEVRDTVLGFLGVGVDTFEVLEPVVEMLGGVGSEGVCAIWQERRKRSSGHCVRRPNGRSYVVSRAGLGNTGERGTLQAERDLLLRIGTAGGSDY